MLCNWKVLRGRIGKRKGKRSVQVVGCKGVAAARQDETRLMNDEEVEASVVRRAKLGNANGGADEL